MLRYRVYTPTTVNMDFVFLIIHCVGHFPGRWYAIAYTSKAIRAPHKPSCRSAYILEVGELQGIEYC